MFLKISVHKNPVTKFSSVKNYNDADWESNVIILFNRRWTYPQNLLLLLVLTKFNIDAATDCYNQNEAELSDGFSALKKSTFQHRKPNIGT